MGSSGETEKDMEIRHVKAEMARVSERDIRERSPRISLGIQSEIRVRDQASRAVLCSDDVPAPAHPAK